jgi:CRISPR-associated protein Cas2
MVILILERVPAGLRGELSRWMLEPRSGVFVGNVSALVRDKLWEKVEKQARGGAALLVHTARTEQGFRVRSHGDPSRTPLDLEGLTLVRMPPLPHRQRASSSIEGPDEGRSESTPGET